MNTFVDSSKYRFIQLGVLLWYLRLAFGGAVEPKASNVTVMRGEMLEISWTVSPASGERVTSLQVYVLPNITSEILTGSSPLVSVYGETVFGVGRLSATFDGSTYKLMLKNLSYADSVTFQLFTIFVIGIQSDIKTSEIQVTVISIPTLCGRNLESRYTVNENRTLSLVQVICGHPKPEVEWKVGDDNFSRSYNSSYMNTAIRQHKYTFRTRPITRNDCGRTLIVVANNTVGSMKRNAKLDVEFVPSLVSMVSLSRYNKTCVSVTWDGEDTGKCVVSYHLQFASRETIYNSSNRYFTLCNSSDVDTVIIWASYKGKNGWKLVSRISTTTSSPYFTSTTNIATTNAGKSVPRTCDCQSTSNVIIAIVVTLAITLILITIIFIIFKHKGYITVSINQKRRPQSNENGSDDYEETGATTSHYADINTKAVKPSIYADLTTTADHSKQYAEIELHKQDTYSNIRD
ncbi:uncharacterized protein LOC130635934 isoform X2 [Hydractinia symbiolongicarpus]|uniref:uncharacterized protein LOC130635934 isoform X2 n=1 Tax=Hydractinia symbiolongicarpus TaxID=13093 RepID=UPI00254D48D1|nr:uncharacterized protein LOC130635934 isoform X2 [Hydractinia symbiolongicarpus]